jgi:hypothetical protein
VQEERCFLLFKPHLERLRQLDKDLEPLSDEVIMLLEKELADADPENAAPSHAGSDASSDNEDDESFDGPRAVLSASTDLKTAFLVHDLFKRIAAVSDELQSGDRAAEFRQILRAVFDSHMSGAECATEELKGPRKLKLSSLTTEEKTAYDLLNHGMHSD